MKKHIYSSEEFRYRFEKPSLRNYVFRGTASEERGGLIFGHITKITPYDDAEYYWAKLEGTLVKFVYDTKVKDKMYLNPYDEEEFESFDEYIDYILETTAEELVNFNKNIKPVMVHY